MDTGGIPDRTSYHLVTFIIYARCKREWRASFKNYGDYLRTSKSSSVTARAPTKVTATVEIDREIARTETNESAKSVSESFIGRTPDAIYCGVSGLSIGILRIARHAA